MDPVTEFQRISGPVVWQFIADNADVLKFLLILTVLVGGWLVADGLKGPRSVFEKLFAKGSSDGKGDIPRED